LAEQKAGFFPRSLILWNETLRAGRSGWGASVTVVYSGGDVEKRSAFFTGRTAAPFSTLSGRIDAAEQARQLRLQVMCLICRNPHQISLPRAGGGSRGN
jgi:superfamily II DNA helicase RecQ